MNQRSRIIPLALLLVLLLGGLGYLEYRHYILWQHSKDLEIELADTKSDLASTTKNLGDTIIALEKDRDDLAQKLLEEQARMNALSAQVEGSTRAIGILQKLAKTDAELLKKYSRVFFLNENYIPEKLEAIDPAYMYEPSRTQYFHANALPFLNALIKEADTQGIDISILSAYRSFGTQTGLKSTYLVTFGTGSNQFSADQGYSEHQLGTAVDFTDSKISAGFSGFEKTTTYQWLVQNAHRFGFVLSYPENNTYYRYEPWHWRFVGRELATKLHDENKYFYDLDQRIIDTYLISLFN